MNREKRMKEIKFIKLHIGLIKFLQSESKRKRTPKKLIYFLKEVGQAYLKELLKLYKELFLIFDSTYREQKKKYDNYNQLKLDLQRALKLLQYIDNKMAKMGKSRQQRRQFWRDFYSRGELRKETFEQLLNELK